VPRFLRGLDEMVLETAYIGFSALVFIVVLSYALNSGPARALEGAPLIGGVIRAVRALNASVANT
jgi:hypothetical protein